MRRLRVQTQPPAALLPLAPSGPSALAGLTSPHGCFTQLRVLLRTELERAPSLATLRAVRNSGPWPSQRWVSGCRCSRWDAVPCPGPFLFARGPQMRVSLPALSLRVACAPAHRALARVGCPGAPIAWRMVWRAGVSTSFPFATSTGLAPAMRLHSVDGTRLAHNGLLRHLGPFLLTRRGKMKQKASR